MLCKNLGHESLSNTQVYTHLSVDRLKEAAKQKLIQDQNKPCLLRKICTWKVNVFVQYLQSVVVCLIDVQPFVFLLYFQKPVEAQHAVTKQHKIARTTTCLPRCLTLSQVLGGFNKV